MGARPLIADCGLPVGTALPGLTAGPEGPALLFVQEKGDTVNLRWASWDGERWSDTVTIAKGTDFLVNWADRPALAFGDGDDAHAHWLQVDPRGDFAYSIQTTHSADGGTTWSAPDVPHRDTAVAEHGFELESRATITLAITVPSGSSSVFRMMTPLLVTTR